MDDSHPLEGQMVLLAGTKASLSLKRLPRLVARVDDHLRERSQAYDQRYESIDGTGSLEYYLVEPGTWEEIGREVGLGDRELDGVRRAHTAQFRRDGRRLDRLEEFESALEIRDVVAIECD